MATSIGKLTIELDFKITFWQAIKLRIAGKGLAHKMVDELIMRRLKELEVDDHGTHMTPESINRMNKIFTRMKDS